MKFWQKAGIAGFLLLMGFAVVVFLVKLARFLLQGGFGP